MIDAEMDNKITSSLMAAWVRAYFDALVERKGEGALVDFARTYGVPDYTISKIRSQDIKLPRADIFFKILRGVKDTPFIELKKHLLNYFDPVNLGILLQLHEGERMPEFIDFMMKFSDILSCPESVDKTLLSALLSLVNSLHGQLKIMVDCPPPKAEPN